MIQVTFGKVIDNLLNDVGIGTNKKSVTQVGTIEKTRLQKLDILTGGTDIKVFIHDKPSIDIVLETVEGGPQLKMSEDEASAVIEAIGGETSWFLFSHLPSNCLYVKVPLDIAASWNIKTGSGDVLIPKARTNSYQVVAGSGDLELSDIKAKEARISVSSGDMTIHGVVADTVQVNTSSGDAVLSNVKANSISGASNSGELKINDVYSEMYTMKVTSGDATMSNIQADAVQLTCTSGDINAENMGAKKAFMKASSGDIDYSFTDDCSIQAIVTSGDMIIIGKSEQPNATINIQTSSGDIDTNISQHIQRQSRKHVTGVVGNGGPLIQLESSSGDMKLLYR